MKDPEEFGSKGWKYYRKTTIYAEKSHKNINGEEVTITRGGFTEIEDLTEHKQELWALYGLF